MRFHYLCFGALMLLYNNAFSYLVSRRVIRQIHDSCTTPDNQPGYCVKLKNCSHIAKQLNKFPILPEVVTFLQKSHCGEEIDKSPKVCCSVSKSANIFTTSAPPLPETASPKSANNFENRLHEGEQKYSVCGKTSRNTWKIIGGGNSTLGDWPWMVALGYSSRSDPGPLFRCGGSLISNKWIITAAHCVLNTGGFKISVARLGDLNLDPDVDDGASPKDIPISEIIPHPGYSNATTSNDIALLGLKDPVTFTAHIRPICIPSKNEYGNDEFYSNKTPFVIGWGSTEYRGPMSNVLQEVQLDIIDPATCATKYKAQSRATIDHRMLCASKKKRDSCQGDSGGPLMMPIKSSYYIVGVVSFGIKCADFNYPGVYTRVAQFSDWIANNTGIEISQ